MSHTHTRARMCRIVYQWLYRLPWFDATRPINANPHYHCCVGGDRCVICRLSGNGVLGLCVRFGTFWTTSQERDATVNYLCPESLAPRWKVNPVRCHLDPQWASPAGWVAVRWYHVGVQLPVCLDPVFQRRWRSGGEVEEKQSHAAEAGARTLRYRSRARPPSADDLGRNVNPYLTKHSWIEIVLTRRGSFCHIPPV